MVIEEGNSFVVVLCLACKTNKEPEFCYLSRGCYLDSYPSEVAAGAQSTTEPGGETLLPVRSP